MVVGDSLICHGSSPELNIFLVNHVAVIGQFLVSNDGPQRDGAEILWNPMSRCRVGFMINLV